MLSLQSFLREGRVVGPCWEKLKPKGPKKGGGEAFLVCRVDSDALGSHTHHCQHESVDCRQSHAISLSPSLSLSLTHTHILFLSLSLSRYEALRRTHRECFPTLHMKQAHNLMKVTHNLMVV